MYTVLASQPGNVHTMSGAFGYLLQETNMPELMVATPMDATNHHELTLQGLVTCIKCLHFHTGTVNILARNQAAITMVLDTSHKVNRHYARSANDELRKWLLADVNNELTLGWLPKEYRSTKTEQMRFEVKRARLRRPPPDILSAASILHEGKKNFHNDWNEELHSAQYTGHSFIRMGRNGKHIKARQSNADIYIRECGRFCRAVTKHASIGSYYQQFRHLKRHVECKSFEGSPPGSTILTRTHILDECHKYSRFWEGWLVQASNSTAFL
jgi:hypothetical protein